MNALAAQQQALVSALWARRSGDAAALLVPHAERPDEALFLRGLQAYRSNGRELAQRALESAYPVVAQLLGEEGFAALARELWLRHPPRRGDLAQWGGELAALVQALPDLHGEEPYLPDLARLEWALHRCAVAADVAPDAGSLALLSEADPARVRLRLVPGTALLPSAWPVASIVLAHLQGRPTLEEAALRLREGVAETALVWRQGFKPMLREVAPHEAAFLAALQEGRALADSLQLAPQLDFGAWLAAAWQQGLLAGAEPC